MLISRSAFVWLNSRVVACLVESKYMRWHRVSAFPRYRKESGARGLMEMEGTRLSSAGFSVQ